MRMNGRFWTANDHPSMGSDPGKHLVLGAHFWMPGTESHCHIDCLDPYVFGVVAHLRHLCCERISIWQLSEDAHLIIHYQQSTIAVHSASTSLTSVTPSTSVEMRSIRCLRRSPAIGCGAT